MRKVLVVIALLLAIAGPAYAQQDAVVTQVIASTDGVVNTVIELNGTASVGLGITTGTAVGTWAHSFEVSSDGTTYASVFCWSATSKTFATSRNTTSLTADCPVSGYQYFRVVTEPDLGFGAAGSLTVTLRGSIAPGNGIVVRWDDIMFVTVTNTVDVTGIVFVEPGTDPLSINCLSGCGGASAFLDMDSFTFGTTPINAVGGVVDDVTPSIVSENSAAAFRMSTNRSLYAEIRGSNFDRGVFVTVDNALQVDASATTQPVSGTFWQATQPVSGTVSISGTVTADTELPTAITLTDVTNNPTTPFVGAANMLYDSGSALWSREYGAKASATVPIPGETSPATALLGMRDDTSPYTATEGNFSALRLNAQRSLYGTLRDAAGNERGANVTAGNALVVDGSAVTQPVSVTTNTDGTQKTQLVDAAGDITDVVTVNASSIAAASKGAVTGSVMFIRGNDSTLTPWAGDSSYAAGASSQYPWVKVLRSSLTVAEASLGALSAELAINIKERSLEAIAVYVRSSTLVGTIKFITSPGDSSFAMEVYDTVQKKWITGSITNPTVDTLYLVPSAGLSSVALRVTAYGSGALLASAHGGPGTSAIYANISGSTLGANSGVDIGDVTINNAAGAAAVNIQDGGNSITIDGTVTVGTFPDNEPFNLAQVNGNTTVTAATGVQKVGIVGNAGAAVDAVNGAAPAANNIAFGVETIAQGNQPTAVTTTNQRRTLGSLEGVQYVQEGNSNRFSCFVQAVTATTQCQAAPGAGLRAYVTSVTMSNQAATVQTLDIVYGTGAACVTGTTALTHKWQFGTLATTTSPFEMSHQFQTPLVPVAANAICVRPSAASAFGATITGYIAP